MGPNFLGKAPIEAKGLDGLNVSVGQDSLRDSGVFPPSHGGRDLLSGMARDFADVSLDFTQV